MPWLLAILGTVGSAAGGALGAAGGALGSAAGAVGSGLGAAASGLGSALGGAGGGAASMTPAAAAAVPEVGAVAAPITASTAGIGGFLPGAATSPVAGGAGAGAFGGGGGLLGSFGQALKGIAPNFSDLMGGGAGEATPATTSQGIMGVPKFSTGSSFIDDMINQELQKRHTQGPMNVSQPAMHMNPGLIGGLLRTGRSWVQS